MNFGALESAWDELWRTACPDNVFSRYRWIRASVDAFDVKDELYILV